MKISFQMKHISRDIDARFFPTETSFKFHNTLDQQHSARCDCHFDPCIHCHNIEWKRKWNRQINLPSIIFLSSSIRCDLSSSVNNASLNCFCTWISGIFYVFFCFVFFDVHDFLKSFLEDTTKYYYNLFSYDGKSISLFITIMNCCTKYFNWVSFPFNKLSFVIHNLFTNQNRN